MGASRHRLAYWDKKKDTLKKYATLGMTVDYLGKSEWNEKYILSRADDLFKSAINMWLYYS